MHTFVNPKPLLLTSKDFRSNHWRDRRSSGWSGRGSRWSPPLGEKGREKIESTERKGRTLI